MPIRDEVVGITQSAPARYRAAIALGSTGLRVGEVLGLTKDRLDLAERLVTVDRQLRRVGSELVLTTPKAEKVRTIKIPGPVAFELRRHVREYRDDGLLFRTPRSGRAMRRDEFYASAWQPALVGAAWTPAGTYSTASATSRRRRCSPRACPSPRLPGIWGTRLKTISRVYAHWLRDDRDVPADALDRLLAPSDDASRVTAASRSD